MPCAPSSDWFEPPLRQHGASGGTAVRSSDYPGSNRHEHNAVRSDGIPQIPLGQYRNASARSGDADELEKRIKDLKAVEGWLKTNLSMLQMTIQGLEMQCATLSAFQAISQSAGNSDANANPFANPALWPWNLMQGAGQTAAAAGTPAAADQAPPKSAGKAK